MTFLCFFMLLLSASAAPPIALRAYPSWSNMTQMGEIPGWSNVLSTPYFFQAVIKRIPHMPLVGAIQFSTPVQSDWPVDSSYGIQYRFSYTTEKRDWRYETHEDSVNSTGVGKFITHVLTTKEIMDLCKRDGKQIEDLVEIDVQVISDHVTPLMLNNQTQLWGGVALPIEQYVQLPETLTAALPLTAYTESEVDCSYGNLPQVKTTGIEWASDTLELNKRRFCARTIWKPNAKGVEIVKLDLEPVEIGRDWGDSHGDGSSSAVTKIRTDTFIAGLGFMFPVPGLPEWRRSLHLEYTFSSAGGPDKAYKAYFGFPEVDRGENNFIPGVDVFPYPEVRFLHIVTAKEILDFCSQQGLDYTKLTEARVRMVYLRNTHFFFDTWEWTKLQDGPFFATAQTTGNLMVLKPNDPAFFKFSKLPSGRQQVAMTEYTKKEGSKCSACRLSAANPKLPVWRRSEEVALRGEDFCVCTYYPERTDNGLRVRPILKENAPQ